MSGNELVLSRSCCAVEVRCLVFLPSSTTCTDQRFRRQLSTSCLHHYFLSFSHRVYFLNIAESV
jgi:hypothetical protein